VANEEKGQSEWRSTRFWLAIGLTGVSVLGVIVLSGITIWRSPVTDTELPMRVMTTVLPLIGTWVGTVLAYYFSKENFEAATRSTAELVRQLTPLERLKSIPVRQKMIAIKDVFFKSLPADEKMLLVDIVDEMEKRKKGNRLPVLSDKSYPLYVLHRSTLDQYLAKEARAGRDVKTLTLLALLNDAGMKDFLSTSFVTVKEDASLAEAKEVMEGKANCQDVFVTKAGGKDEEVRGLITNVIIQESSVA